MYGEAASGKSNLLQTIVYVFGLDIRFLSNGNDTAMNLLHKMEYYKNIAVLYAEIEGYIRKDSEIIVKAVNDGNSSTIAASRRYLDNHIYPFFGNMKLCEITPILVKEFRKAMLDKGRKNSTVNKYMVFLGSIFNFMIDNDVPVRNPLAKIKNLKVAKNEKIRALSTVEVQALLSKTKVIYPDFYPLLFTAIFTGMRKGEILALTWNSINWITQKITVDKNYTHGGLGTPKTGKIRVIDMSNELAKVLKEWRLACPHSELNLVFPNSNGNYQSADNLAKRRFLPALNRAGIDKIRFHDLRHTYASLLLAVQHQLGHFNYYDYGFVYSFIAGSE